MVKKHVVLPCLKQLLNYAKYSFVFLIGYIFIKK